MRSIWLYIVLSLLILGVGALVVFIFIRQPIQIAYEGLSPTENEKLLKLKVPEKVVSTEARGELIRESTLTIKNLMGIPFIRAQIDGQSYLLQLDFGSRYTLLSPDIALQLQLPIVSELHQEKSPMGEFGFYFAYVREIQLGTARVLNERVTIPLQKISAKLFGFLNIFAYKGLIGAQTLKHFTITLNLAKNQLILHPKGWSPPSGITVAFTSVRGLILLRGFLDGHGPFNLLLDPGAPGLVVSPRIAEQLELEPAKKCPSVELKLPLLPVTTQQVCVTKTLQEARTDGVQLDGLIGRSFLMQWKVTVDFDKQVLYFESP